MLATILAEGGFLQSHLSRLGRRGIFGSPRKAARKHEQTQGEDNEFTTIWLSQCCRTAGETQMPAACDLLAHAHAPMPRLWSELASERRSSMCRGINALIT